MFHLDNELFELNLTEEQKKELYYCLIESYHQGEIVLSEDNEVNNLTKMYCKNKLYIGPWYFDTWGIEN